jgi:hypothetical protein
MIDHRRKTPSAIPIKSSAGILLLASTNMDLKTLFANFHLPTMKNLYSINNTTEKM